MIGVGVREQDPTHPLFHRAADDRINMAFVVRAGIDHRYLIDADEVRVGTGPGHESGVGRKDAPHELRQSGRNPRAQRGIHATSSLSWKERSRAMSTSRRDMSARHPRRASS